MDFIKIEQLETASPSNDTFSPFQLSEIEQSLTARFEAQVAKYAQQLAISQGEQSLT